MRTHRGTVAVALLVGLGGLVGCDALPVGEEVHVTAILEVQILDWRGNPLMPPALVKFTAAKKENGNVIGTTFEFNAFTDLDGKVSFTVGYNLQKSSQWIHLEVNYCSLDSEGRSCPYREIRYDEALAQSAGTGIAVITKSMVLPA